MIHNSTDEERSIRITKVMYGLHCFFFLFGVSYLVAMIMNYIYRPDVRGTWLESHFIWQARTFWFSLTWYGIGALLSLLLIGYLICFLNTIWIFYRAIRGYRALGAGQPMHRFAK